MKITIVEEWNYYDGFREGILRIEHERAFNQEGDLYWAIATDYQVDNDEPTHIEARSLFHAFSEAKGYDTSRALADPGALHFTYAELYATSVRDPSFVQQSETDSGGE